MMARLMTPASLRRNIPGSANLLSQPKRIGNPEYGGSAEHRLLPSLFRRRQLALIRRTRL
jgi:hypothetical protein